MKQFFIYIVKIFFAIAISAIVLDLAYSYVYLKTEKRNKIVNIYNTKSKNFDIVILGSSRANNHFVTQLFNDKGLKSFNYGMSGSSLEESVLMLKLMLERNYKMKNIIVEVDLNLSSNGFSEGTRARFMPYLHYSNVIKQHYKNRIPNFNTLYYVPFYRYVNYEAKIGFREMFFSAINKKSNDLDQFGYYPLLSQTNDMKYDLSKRKPIRNVAFDEMMQICKKNNINLIAITTPICQNTVNFNYFKQIKEVYPEVRNYEQVIQEDRYFSSCGHLNNEGAKLFTQYIIKDLFNK